MLAQAIELLRDRSLPMLIEQEIERVILGGEYAPGDKINEQALALRFGISRGPIREALRSLDRTGLIDTIPNRGVFVRRLTAAQAAEIYDVRAALFALAGQCLAIRASAADVERLRGHVAAMDEAVARDDFETYITENFALHEAIVTRAGNATLATHYLALVKQLRLYRTRNLMLADSVQASNEEHREMVEAIAARDPARAYAAHFNHVATAKIRLMANHLT
ncbi:transcriptional regulator, GntR family [Bosea sp. OK403]|uniref:FCD domain-containing protein n=1 Tax=Bosea sp. OK403 TaxID=1855286 RepID=UPI0008E2B044|nr:FCD domain-containing protein [Bosea sp. OK403]SFI47887.1 transcriptional regulator, GntR family [Bosea sp. OK403]